jgi:hypothetical protein
MFRHVGIVVNNMNSMLSFYMKVFELNVISNEIENGNFLDILLGNINSSAHIIKLGKNKSTFLELLYFQKCDLEYKSLFTNGITHFAVTVDDISLVVNNVIKYGGSIINLPEINDSKSCKVCFCRDIENNFIEIVQILNI